MRARDLITFKGTPGKFNSITDIDDVEVGHSTVISGDGKLIVGEGPVRTGVTVIFPRGKSNSHLPVFAAHDVLNGNGEMTGTIWVEESGFLETPIAITNTHSVGIVRDTLIKWITNNSKFKDSKFSLPLIAETYDGVLNDINGHHVKEKHLFEAISNSNQSSILEGNVGGGTGMICHQFKGGIGTSSREVVLNNSSYLVGTLVQANYGRREDLTINGINVGEQLIDQLPEVNTDYIAGDGSIIVIVATNAPLLPTQLKRLAKRASLGIGRVGGIGSNGSGDIFLAFSTSNLNSFDRKEITNVQMISNETIDPLLRGVVESTEESIINALFAANTMSGINNNTVYELPINKLKEIVN
ncbi:MAG: P1 family peptidase [Dehalococcoidia bacterium]